VLKDSSDSELGTSINPISVSMGKGLHLDSFNRLRTSAPNIEFDAQHHFGQEHYQFVGVATAGGTLTEDPDTSSLILAVTSTTGDKYVNRSRRHYYQAGLSKMAIMTWNPQVLDAPATAVVEIFIRSSTSGTPLETIYPRSGWIDTLDGSVDANNPSGVLLDLNACNIEEIDLQWLGVGMVRCAKNLSGMPVEYVAPDHANNKTTVYMQTANLPVTYEIEKTATGIIRSLGYYDDDDGIGIRITETTANGGSMMQICTSVLSEGAGDLLALQRAKSNDFTPVTATASGMVPILSIRPAALYRGRTNKGLALVLEIEVFTTGLKPIHWEAWEDATLTAPNWQPVAADDTMMEYDVTASAATTTTNRTRDEGYLAASAATTTTNRTRDEGIWLRQGKVGRKPMCQAI
jgi:hypothetical protein